MNRLSVLPALSLTLVLCAAASAQQIPLGFGDTKAAKSTPASSAPDTTEALKAKLATAQAELDRYVADRVPAGIPEADVLERRALLELVVGGYQRQLDSRDDLALAERRLAALEKKAAAGTGLPAGPHALEFVDELRDTADAMAKQLAAAEARLQLLTQQVEAWRGRLKEAEAKLRLADEQAGPGGAETERRAWLRDLAALRVRGYGTVLAGIDSRAEVTRTEVREDRLELELAERRLADASKSVQFTRADLDRTLARLDREKAALEREMREMQSQSLVRREALRKAEAELDAARAARPPASAARQTQLERVVELRRVQAENANIGYDLVRGMADANPMERASWVLRYERLNERDPAKLREAYERVEQLRKTVQPWRAYAQREYEAALTQQRQLEARLAMAQSQEESTVLRELVDGYRDRAALYDRVLRAIARVAVGLNRWTTEFEAGRATQSVWAHALDAWAAARRVIRAVWDFELFTADDTVEVDGRKITATRSVTVGKSVGAIVLLVAGYLVVSWLVRRLERGLVAQFKADPALARTARRWLQFILLAVLFVLALDLVKIPLTVFAFLGGALAIGFGFGAQNLLKNLMSGIMILIERPVKVGDIVQIGELVGTVTNISIRSSTIRSADGIETVIPNANFIENNVTNWTYSSPKVRRVVKVSVAYGSDTRKVADTLLGVADRHGLVLKDPAPRVIFEDFGADGLAFALEYWIDYSQGVDGRQLASDLRFMTEKALAESGIVVPFPQRDVRLDAVGPLRVEVVSRAEPQALPRQSRG